MSIDGSRIILDIHRDWLKDELTLAKRLACLIVGQQSHPVVDHEGKPHLDPENGKLDFTGYKIFQKTNNGWQLDMGNNWWLHVEGDKAFLNTRYWDDETMTLLDKLIPRLLG